MKIIISHDIDHLSVLEHYKDLIIPKFVMRSLIEYFQKAITKTELGHRLFSVIKNEWNNIEELMKFDSENNIPATYFIGVANGLGLSYSLEKTKKWIKIIINNDFNIGVHGIAFKEFNKIKQEYNIFQSLNNKICGIRIHYLRLNKNTLLYLNKAGYLYDSSIFKLQDCYKIGNLWEFPLNIMDSALFFNRSAAVSNYYNNMKKDTLRIMNIAIKKKLKYLTILFHPNYFCKGYEKVKDWYLWLIYYLKDRFKFINYYNAIKELDS